jgi:hypothetical protein
MSQRCQERKSAVLIVVTFSASAKQARRESGGNHVGVRLFMSISKSAVSTPTATQLAARLAQSVEPLFLQSGG